MRVRPSLRMVCTVASSAWLLATLLACGQGYRSGTLETGTDSETAAASCLEMRVSPHSDERLRELGWIGVEYEMGNACDGAVPVDLSSAVVVASPLTLRQPTEDGTLPPPVYLDNHVGDTPIMLALWDPQEVVQPAKLDGRRTAREVIAYVVPPGLADLNVCVEIAPVLNADVEPVCFRWNGAS